MSITKKTNSKDKSSKVTKRPVGKRRASKRKMTVTANPARRPVALRVGLHKTSSFVLKLKPEQLSIPTPLAVSLPAMSVSSRRWFQEISILSVIAGLGLLVIRIAQLCFRVPISYDTREDAAYRLVNTRTWLRHLDWSAPVGALEDSVASSGVKKIRNNVILDSAVKNPMVAPVQMFSPPPRLGLRLAGVAVASLIILSPLWLIGTALGALSLRADVVRAASEAVTSLSEGSSALQQKDIDRAVTQFAFARQDFAAGLDTINRLPPVLRMLANIMPGGDRVSSAEQLLEAGQLLSDGANQVSILIKKTPVTDAASAWRVVREAGALLGPILQKSENALALVRSGDVPVDSRDVFDKIRAALPAVRATLSELNALAESDVLGDRTPQRYLLVFQNNHELRPSGGFMGSFAVIEMRHGNVRVLRFPGGGTYDAQGSLLLRHKAPAPLQLVNPRWEFQDTNWSPDFPTAAQTIERYFRAAGNESIDGVIAIDASVVERLLKLTGPIPMPSYKTTISAENFVTETQTQVEIKYDKIENKPKQFLADLMPLFGERLQQLMATQSATMIQTIADLVAEKHILVWLKNSEAQLHAVTLGLAGKLEPLPSGYDGLAVVLANIAGGKTDQVVKTTVDHAVALAADGQLTDTVTMTRQHQGVKGDVFSGVRNVEYVRFYVPAGSELLAATGFTSPDARFFQPVPPDLKTDLEIAIVEETQRTGPGGLGITEELGRTVFGGWVMVDPGMETTVSLQYRLPWRLNASSTPWQAWAANLGLGSSAAHYKFVWSKQPGAFATQLTHSFIATEPVVITKATAPVIPESHGWRYAREVVTNQDWTVTFSIAP